ncbi:MAG TPA: carboxypeptidase M32 [Tepidisphaeraceae bacterium]|jgi:carboxypeptidase Taq|nr:carboxypeptidase M32 [Tepidisphaeraceae bacterium]
MSNARRAYENLIRETRETATLNSVAWLLGWDERTYMPPAGAEHRASQSSLIARMVHERASAPQIGEWLSAIEGSDLVRDPHSDAGANVREHRRHYDRATKIPATLVEEMSKTEVLAQQVWTEARKESDFAKFSPWLKKIVDLKKQEAKCVGYKEHLYDALLDPYEPDETTSNLRRVFDGLRAPLVDLIGRIASSGKKAPVELLERKYPAKLQEQLSLMGAKAIGFDFSAGRLDVSVHPFCSGHGPGDTRITTRYDENYFGDAFFGVLHETGHALYDQGLPMREHFGEPIADSISLGIHESQSRMWENLVGRSKSFWQHFLPKAKEIFGDTMRDVTLDGWHFAINDVRPSFIRVEADEATYNLHILLRFELEQAMLTDDLKIDDLPSAWNERMQKYLGITPPSDAKGCLQDIHWSGGSIGYFPTYTLGNLYAAQFFEQVRKDVGDLDAQFARGDFASLLGWLREKIHRHGKRYSARDLVNRVTGNDLSAKPLLDHLNRKASELYGV